MANTWIVIANASEAQLYTLDHQKLSKGKIELALKDSHNHPESRQKSSELVSDRLGRYKSRGAAGAFVSATDPKEHEAEVFAIELANNLKNKCVQHEIEQLVLIAPPHFMGMLNKHLDKNVTQIVTDTIEKDYTKIPIIKLKKYMESHFLKTGE